MKQFLFRAVLSFILMLCVSVSLSAQSDGVGQSTSVLPKKVYMFAVSRNLIDSIVYVSEIAEIADANFDRAGLIVDAHEYSRTFADYLRVSRGGFLQTAAIDYDTDREKLSKRWVKLREQQDGRREGGVELRVVDIKKGDFLLHRYVPVE